MPFRTSCHMPFLKLIPLLTLATQFCFYSGEYFLLSFFPFPPQSRTQSPLRLWLRLWLTRENLNFFLRLSWRPPAEHKARGLWVRDCLHQQLGCLHHCFFPLHHWSAVTDGDGRVLYWSTTSYN